MLVMKAEAMQKAVFDLYMQRGWKLFAKNTNALGWECDMLGITKSDYVGEFEIKRSRQDYKKDFKKDKHVFFAGRHLTQGFRHTPNYFYFVIPVGLVAEIEIPEYAGLIEIVKDGFDNRYKAQLTKDAPKLHTEKALQIVKDKIAVSLMWGVFNKISSKTI